MSEGRFIARASVARAALLVAGSLGFVAVSVWLLRLPPGEIDETAMIAAYVGIVFFGLCAVAWARQFFRTEPVIEIDGDGILWRRWSDRTIPWHAITGFSVLQIGRQRSLTIKLVDPTLYPGKGVMGLLAGANRGISGGDISLNVAGTDRGFDEMLAAIDHFAPPRAA